MTNRARSPLHLLIAAFAILFFHNTAISQPNPAPIKVRVVVHAYDQIVIIQPDGSYAGLEVDALRAVAHRRNWECEFTKVPDLETLIQTLEKGEADVGLAGLTPTLEREQRVDFSYPYLKTGYSVMSPLVDPVPLWERCLIILPPVFGLVAITVIIAILARFTEHKEGEPWWEHTWDASLRVLQVMLGGAPTDIKNDRVDPNAKELRILGLVTVAIGWLMVTTVADSWVRFQRAADRVPMYSRLDQLRGMKVGTKDYSSSVGLLQRNGIEKIRTVAHIDDLVTGLKSKNFQAVVFDTHALTHILEKHNAKTDFGVADPFTYQYDAIATRPAWPHLEELDQTLLELEELGMLTLLQERYYPELQAR